MWGQAKPPMTLQSRRRDCAVVTTYDHAHSGRPTKDADYINDVYTNINPTLTGFVNVGLIMFQQFFTFLRFWV